MANLKIGLGLLLNPPGFLYPLMVISKASLSVREVLGRVILSHLLSFALLKKSLAEVFLFLLIKGNSSIFLFLGDL